MTGSQRGLLVSRDLFFGSKITGTAASLGYTVDVVGEAAQVVSKLRDADYACLLLDLALPGLDVASLMSALPAGQRPKVIAFGAHVQTELLNAARAARCDEVLPRSRFSAQLPELLKQVLGNG